MAEAEARAPERPAARVLPCVLAFALPGLGHVALGRRATGAVHLVAISALFGFGLRMGGEFFPLSASAPLTFLAALAEMGVGGLYVVATLAGLGAGDAAAPTYEYGYTFLIAAGLLNFLVALDAWDIATGAKENGEPASSGRIR